MKRFLPLLVCLAVAPALALAFHCPKDMKEIDEALSKKPNLTEAQLKEVSKLRADGEAFHKAGKHQESVDSLAKAKDLLGLKTK